MKIDFKTLNEKSGIYCIKNKVTQKMYIGSSKNIYDRLHLHFHRLRNNKHSNKHLQNSFNKYREESFFFYLLEFCPPEMRLLREQHYIDSLKPEYNKSFNVIGSLGVPLPEERKIQISETLKRKYANKEIIAYNQNKKWFKVYLYDIFSLEFYKQYDNIISILRDFNMTGKPSFTQLCQYAFRKRYVISTKELQSKEEILIHIKNTLKLNSKIHQVVLDKIAVLNSNV